MRDSVQWFNIFFTPLAVLSKHMVDARASKIMNQLGYDFISQKTSLSSG